MSGHIISTYDGELRIRLGQHGRTVEICIDIEDPEDRRAVAELTPEQCDTLISRLVEYIIMARNTGK